MIALRPSSARPLSLAALLVALVLGATPTAASASPTSDAVHDLLPGSVARAVDPLVSASQPLTGAVTDPVAAAATPVTDAVGTTTEPVRAAVDPVVEPVVRAAAPITTALAARVVTPVAAAAAATSGGTNSPKPAVPDADPAAASASRPDSRHDAPAAAAPAAAPTGAPVGHDGPNRVQRDAERLHLDSAVQREERAAARQTQPRRDRDPSSDQRVMMPLPVPARSGTPTATEGHPPGTTGRLPGPAPRSLLACDHAGVAGSGGAAGAGGGGTVAVHPALVQHRGQGTLRRSISTPVAPLSPVELARGWGQPG
ncbi:MAG: hypothetical protein PGN13_15275 [Patulibacter minatonensis]